MLLKALVVPLVAGAASALLELGVLAALYYPRAPLARSTAVPPLYSVSSAATFQPGRGASAGG